MDDPSVVAERGVLTAPAEVWRLAVRRAGQVQRRPVTTPPHPRPQVRGRHRGVMS